MGELLCVDFKARSRRYTKTDERTLEQQAVSLSLDSPIDVLYETTLGFAAKLGPPDIDVWSTFTPIDENHYHAPSDDTA